MHSSLTLVRSGVMSVCTRLACIALLFITSSLTSFVSAEDFLLLLPTEEQRAEFQREVGQDNTSDQGKTIDQNLKTLNTLRELPVLDTVQSLAIEQIKVDPVQKKLKPDLIQIPLDLKNNVTPPQNSQESIRRIILPKSLPKTGSSE